MIILIKPGLNLQAEALTRKAMRDGWKVCIPMMYKNVLIHIIHLLKNKKGFIQNTGFAVMMVNITGSLIIQFPGFPPMANFSALSAPASILIIKKDSEKK